MQNGIDSVMSHCAWAGIKTVNFVALHTFCYVQSCNLIKTSKIDYLHAGSGAMRYYEADFIWINYSDWKHS